MPRFFDDSDDTKGPIDLDRLAIDSDYRRAIMLRLKAESQQDAGPVRTVAFTDATPPRKD
ncbi:MAG TPA: hypothetical protein VMU85_01740 [Stellaceae bacterium]|nr:hypothetical protein [Stellaceae bacterium]